MPCPSCGDINENGVTGSSPYCGVILLKSIVFPSTRAGVPVLNRRNSNPSSCSESASGFAFSRPCGPPYQLHSPMMIRLFRYTPQQSIAARHSILSPVVVSTAVTRPFSTTMREASACLNVSLSCRSIALRMRSRYASLSACARSECTAGPFPVLSMRFCMKVSSIARPISPPSASNSRTR